MTVDDWARDLNKKMTHVICEVFSPIELAKDLQINSCTIFYDKIYNHHYNDLLPTIIPNGYRVIVTDVIRIEQNG